MSLSPRSQTQRSVRPSSRPLVRELGALFDAESNAMGMATQVPDRLSDFNSQTQIKTEAGVRQYNPWKWHSSREAADWTEIDGNPVWIPKPKVIQLKSREIGSSEWYTRRYLHMQRRFGAGDIIIVPDKEEHGQNIIEQAQFVVGSAPADFFPRVVGSNKSEIVFEDGTGVYAMPGTSSAARSERGRYFLCTEMAFWEYAIEQWGGLQGAMAALDAEGEQVYIVIESTAQGVGNLFHQMWTLAKTGENGYDARFDGRWANPNHTKAWFLSVTQNMAATPHLIAQEYPETESEAFLESGRTFFSVWFRSMEDGIQTYDSEAREVRVLNDLEAIHLQAKQGFPTHATDWKPELVGPQFPQELTPITDSLHFHRGADSLEAWTPPVYGRKYVIGADVALGLAHGDYDDATVLDWETAEEVAHLRGHWEPFEYGEFLYWLLTAYPGVLAIERQGPGGTVIEYLRKQRKLDYPELYHAASTGRERRWQTYEPARGLAGFHTNEVTRPLILNGLAQALALDLHRPRAASFWMERTTFVRNDKGRPEASEGFHDDDVMSRAIALHVRGGPQPVQRGGVTRIRGLRRGR